MSKIYCDFIWNHADNQEEEQLLAVNECDCCKMTHTGGIRVHMCKEDTFQYRMDKYNILDVCSHCLQELKMKHGEYINPIIDILDKEWGDKNVQ